MTTSSDASTSQHPPAPSEPVIVKTGSEKRYLALDAFRGFIMIMLAGGGFGFGRLLGHPTYGHVASWFEHVDWEGGMFWDMIQPSFMFMVGVAMPFALARRKELGRTDRQNFNHVSVRALKLILLSQILIIVSSQRLQFQLINVLSQIAFTYFFTYLLLQLPFRRQAIAAGLILAFHTALFFAFPGPEGAFSKTGNIGQVIDQAVLGYTYRGYYVTINFISSTVTTLFGAWTGMLLMSERPRMEKLKILGISMVAAFAGGLGLSLVVPNVKRLWTASFTLYSTGWVLFMMLLFVLLIEVWGIRKPFFPLVVVGMNSIFIYSLGFLLRRSIVRWLTPFTGGFAFAGDLQPVARACSALLVMWYLCYWLYKRKIFLKI
jgi:predicted acyltransferase